MEQIKKLLRHLCENEVRVIVAIMTLWVGVPRLIPGAQFGGLRFADPIVYGILMTIIGVAILVTCYNGYSRTVWGKLISGIAFVSWAMLAAATTSLTSLGINITIAALLLIEVYRNGQCK